MVNEIKGRSGLIDLCLENGMKPESFVRAVVSPPEMCGGPVENVIFDEYLSLFSPWFVFFEINNASMESIVLNNIKGLQYSEFGDFSDLSKEDKVNWSQYFPPNPIKPGESVMIPLTILLENQFTSPNKYESLTIMEEYSWEVAERHQLFIEKNLLSEKNTFTYLATRFLPRSLSYSLNDVSYELSTHELDLNRVYTIDSQIMCGSCPHLFVIKQDGAMEFVRSLFTLNPGEECLEKIEIKSDWNLILICELEPEITYLSQVILDGKEVLTDFKLEEGDEIEIEVKGSRQVTITGKYISEIIRTDFAAIQQRNRLVSSRILADDKY